MLFRSPVVTGSPLSVYDNYSEKEVVHESVYPVTALLSFGDGVQTHWMAADSVNGGHPIPFQLNFENRESQPNMRSTFTPKFWFQTSVTDIGYVSGKSSFEMACSSGSAIAELSHEEQSANTNPYSVSSLSFTTTGFGATCAGAATVNAYASSHASLNYATIEMGRYVFSQITHHS